LIVWIVLDITGKNKLMNKLSNSRNRTILLLLFILPGIVGLYLLFMTFKGLPPLPELPYYGINSVSQTDTTYHKLPAFNFLNQKNEIVNNDTLKNEICVVGFFNTQCDDGCEAVIKNLVELQDFFSDNDDLKILSISTKPQQDLPEILNAYAKTNEIKTKQWHLLTANFSKGFNLDIINNFINSKFFKLDKNRFPNLKQNKKLWLIDKEQRIRGYFDGSNQQDIERLKESIEILKLSYGTHKKYR